MKRFRLHCQGLGSLALWNAPEGARELFRDGGDLEGELLSGEPDVRHLPTRLLSLSRHPHCVRKGKATGRGRGVRGRSGDAPRIA